MKKTAISLERIQSQFMAGICVCLQVVASHDNGVIWREIVDAVGVEEVIEYATKVEPEERELIKLDKYLNSEF